MAKDDSSFWTVTISGVYENPNDDKLILMRRGHLPQIFLEVEVPGIQAAGQEQRQMGRAAIQSALTDLQQALDTPRVLAGFGPD